MNESNAKSLTTSPVWNKLRDKAEAMQATHMRNLFADDPERFKRFSLKFEDILLDFSKNRLDDETFDLLMKLAEQQGVADWCERMFKGEKINTAEDRSVLHVALRNRSNEPILVDGEDVMPAVNEELEYMREFTRQVRSGEWLGYTGKPIDSIVNIGIGGSDLGPAMVCDEYITSKGSDSIDFIPHRERSSRSRI
jgi:glucose-6-phosphate isomerase